MLKTIFYFCCSLLFLITFYSLQAATFTPEIFINEIMYNPAGSDDDHEWLELYNFSTSTHYLLDNQWKFNDGSNHNLNLIIGDDIFSPGEYWILTDNDQIFLQDYPEFNGTLIDTVMSLNNTSDVLSLSIDSGQTFFATTTYQSALGASDNGRTLEVIDFSPDSWQESYVLGGTPGQINSLPPLNLPPTVEIIGPATGTIEELLIFSASSTDPDGDELDFIWQIGNLATATGETIEYQFFASGTYEILVEADDSQFTATATHQIIISEIIEPEPEPEPEPDEDPEYSAQIIINEILPNPVGSDNDEEFIELYNRGSVAVDLLNWRLSDATASEYTIASEDFTSTIIPAYGYLVIYRTASGLALNNDQDLVELFQPNGNLLDQVNYSNVEEGQSYAKLGETFSWTIQPTAGQANLIVTEQPEPQIVYVNNSDDSQASQSSDNNIDQDSQNNNQANLTSAELAYLMITEFLPNPTGSDDQEWIEIYNSSSQSLNIAGIKLDDMEGGSWAYVFPNETIINGGSYLIIPKSDSNIALNNSNEQVRLLDYNDQILQTVSYTTAKEGQSDNYDFLEQEWFWSDQLTPGSHNISLADQNFFTIALETDEENFSAEADESEINFPFVSLEEIKFMEKNDKLSTLGVVAVVSDLLGKRIIYIIDQTNPLIGLQLYSSSHDFLHYAVGDLIEVKGKVSFSQNEARLLLDKNEDIITVDKVNLPEIEISAIEDLSEETVGGLIKVAGELVEKKGSDYYLDDGTGEIRVYLKKETGIVKPEIEEGGYLEVTGILTLTKSGLRLLPRYHSDVVTGQVLGESEINHGDNETEISNEEIIMKANDQSAKILKILMFIGGATVVSLLSLIVKKKLKLRMQGQ